MLLDWDNPPTLSSRKRQIRDIDALSKAKERRAKKKPSKAHATKGRMIRFARAKAKAAKLRIEANLAAVKEYKDAARAYWRGESDAHP